MGLEGCVITAAHCDIASDMGVFFSEKIEGQRNASKVDSRKILTKDGKETDIAIFKVSPPIPQEHSASSSILANKYPRAKQAVRPVG